MPKLPPPLAFISVDERSQLCWKTEPTKPLPPLTPPVEPFDPALLPESFRSFVEDQAELLSCPPDFVAVPLMVSAASALGRGLAIRPKRLDNWHEVANLWGAIIAPPSSSKSPAFSAGMKFLESIDTTLREKNKEAMETHAAALICHEEEMKAAKKKMGDATQKNLDPATVPLPPPPEKPRERRFIVNSVTPEKLVSIHTENPRGLLEFRDELTGWLRSFEKAGRENERSLYLEAWTGKNPFRGDTLKRGCDYLPAACVSVLGGIQPGPFQTHLKDERNGARADGLLQRFSLLVWPEFRPFSFVDRMPDRKAEEAIHSVFRRLTSINAEDGVSVGEVEQPGDVPFLRFSESAQEAFNQWIASHMQRLQSADVPETMQSHLSKYRKALPSLALLFEVIDSPHPREVSLASWQRAERWAAYLESHARKVYAPAVNRALQSAHALLQKIEEGKLPSEFSIRDVYRPQWSHLKTPEEAKAALNVLAEHGHLDPKKDDHFKKFPAL